MFIRLITGKSWVDRPCQPADIAKPGAEASAPGRSDGIFSLYPRRFACPTFSMLKTAVLTVETKRFRASEKNFFPYRPETSSDECQHADMAERCFDERWEKYSALYFFLVGDDEKRLHGRGSVLSSTWGLANG